MTTQTENLEVPKHNEGLLDKYTQGGTGVKENKLSPEKIEKDQICNLTKEQTFLYETTVREGMKIVEGSEGIKRRGIIFKYPFQVKPAYIWKFFLFKQCKSFKPKYELT